MNEELRHRPVLVEEVLRLLAPRPGGVYVDGTVGDAGHARAILEASAPDGRLVGLDRDPQALERARSSLAPYGERARLAQRSYRDAPEVLAETGVPVAQGILLDLGASTLQLLAAERGFGFREAGPLDMRMDPSGGPTALELLGSWDEEELTRVLRTYGEEPFAGRIARAIRRARDEGRLETTQDLAAAVARAVPPKARYGRIHPATRTFQALRIAVNDELAHLEGFLARFVSALAPGGVAVVLTYHSLEDRRVKRAFREAARRGEVVDLTKHPLRPSEDETRENPRARSAKLRAVRRAA